MKPNATPRKTAGRFPGRAAGCWLFALGLALPRLAAAATPPERALRLSPTITAPATDFPAEERALLRVEYQAARTQSIEADIVGDILTRVRRVDDMIREIHGLVESWPQTGAAPAPPAATPAAATPAPADPRPAAAPPADGGTSTSRADLTLRALMASALVFLFWLLGKRHIGVKAQRPDEAASAPSPAVAPKQSAEDEMAVAMAMLVTPPKPAGRAVIEAIEPTIEPITAEVDTTAPPIPPLQSAPEAPTTLDIQMPPELEAIARSGQATPDSVPRPRSPLPETAPDEPGTDETLELAEIMVSMGLASGAAQTLTEHIRDNPKHALYHWLRLLDIYRRSEMREDFERSAQDLHQYFNVQPAGWAAGSHESHSLEDYPHLAARLQQLWPTPRNKSIDGASVCAEFLSGLLEDNRGGARDGFPQSVAEEILLLERMLDVEAVPA